VSSTSTKKDNRNKLVVGHHRGRTAQNLVVELVDLEHARARSEPPGG
jgi:hypothetical protein